MKNKNKELKLEKYELDSKGEFEKDFSLMDNLTKKLLLSDTNFISEFNEHKPVYMPTEKIEIANTGNFLDLKDVIVNMPLELIVFPFFTTRNNNRKINFEYEFKDLGLTMYSKLTPLNEQDHVIQPSTFEKKIFDFLLLKYEEQVDHGIFSDYIDLWIEDFIINFLDIEMNTNYYSKIESSLYNIKNTEYEFRIKNYKKAGNFLFEDESFKLLNYKKIKEGRKIFYRIRLNGNIVKKIHQKRYIKFNRKQLVQITDADNVALRIYQYLSMKRFDKNTGEYRLEVLAGIVPLKMFATRKVKNNKGEIKEYKFSTLSQVLKRIKKAFDVLERLNYIKTYKVEKMKEEKSYLFKFTFGEEECHISTYIKKDKNLKEISPLENKEQNLFSLEIPENLKIEIVKAKRNIFFSRSYNLGVEKKLLELYNKKGFEFVKKLLSQIYTGLKEEIKKDLTAYIITISKNLVFSKKGKEYVENEKEEIKKDDIQQNDSNKLIALLYANLNHEKKAEIEMKAYKMFANEAGDTPLQKKIYRKEMVKMSYIQKAIKEIYNV